MDRIVKVCQILAIIYYLLLQLDNVCQAAQPQNGTDDINQLISEIFDIPNGQDGQHQAQTSDRGGSNQTPDFQPQPTSPQYPVKPTDVSEPEPNHTQPPSTYGQTPVTPVHPEQPEYKPPPPPQQTNYPTPTGTPTGPYSNVGENEPNVSTKLLSNAHTSIE